ncbi:LysM peptidoglycan-binding domain-containing protein [Variovorax paradoxus]|uniref:LysM peptidoglycan-binding domain-containing protein n=1 Tax=Variovorax paradoxus TaxID=34073 RepID=UPI0021ABE112|nr:LysM peptidoglycan-binding domain-containing protein [Variovorax paradoxus]UVH58080.1 LysM peptidoglycan-binding domain-containing protein [Variovorax paradoxus]
MPKLISATYHPNIEVAEFICEDGRHLLRSGGTLPWRINNPGDLTARMVDGVPAPRKAKGYVGFATTRSGRTFLIFPDEDSGREELKANLKRLHGERTISEAIPIYAPKKENDTEKYTSDLLKTSGIPAYRKIGECTNAELEKIINGISEIEGYHANAETRKEIWVVVSRINATNGSQPLPDTEIILQREGKEEKVRSDATGRFPPVIHPADNSAVHVKVADPKTKEYVTVGSIQGSAGKDFNLLAKFRKWKGVAGSEKINSSTPRQKKPMSYVVLPGDSLWKIAKLYRTSVTAIKDENRLSSDRIYPGEVLLIHGSGKVKLSDNQPTPPAATAKAPATPVTPPKRPIFPPPPAPPISSSIEPSDSERSKGGMGQVLALINPAPGRAPWMPIAIAEAKLRYGRHEEILGGEIDYHVEIGDGSKSLAKMAWCAAFANWCLLKAGYPIDNVGFRDHRATMGRAHGFYEMDEERKIRNPLFVELDRPIYGAISVATYRSGHGYHVGLAYGKASEEDLILLGGNQDDRIRFSAFNMNLTRTIKVIGKDGRNKDVVVKNPKYLRYFVPVAYHEKAKKELESPGLESMSVDALNKVIGVPPDSKKKKAKTKTD